MNAKRFGLGLLGIAMLASALGLAKPAAAATPTEVSALSCSHTLVLQADRDTTTESPAFVYPPNATVLKVARPALTGSTTAFLHFNLGQLPSTAQVCRALLRVFVVGASGANPENIMAYKVNANWPEALPFPGPAVGPVNYGMFPVSNVFGSSASWNLLPAVNLWQVNPATNYGVALRALVGPTAQRYFASREHANPAFRPQLIIVY